MTCWCKNTPLNSNKLKNRFFVNNFYIYIANASNATWYDRALIALYSGQILAFCYQPNLRNSHLNFVGVKPPPSIAIALKVALLIIDSLRMYLQSWKKTCRLSTVRYYNYILSILRPPYEYMELDYHGSRHICFH